MTSGGRTRPPKAAPDETQARRHAETLRQALAARPTARQIAQARELLVTLRNLRAWPPLMALAEALCRLDASDATPRRLYAQALIETGSACAAIGLLQTLTRSLSASDAEFGEAWGLLGRAHKQIFADAAGAAPSVRQAALAAALQAYGVPWRADAMRHTWHGVNLLALLARARREGWDAIEPGIDTAQLAQQLTIILQAQLAARPDDWTLATLAEVSLGLSLAGGDLQVVEGTLLKYLASEGVTAFHVASTLRQFTQVWELDRLSTRTRGVALRGEAAVQRARCLIDLLRARLLQLPGGALEMGVAQVAPTPPRARPSQGQLEAVLGVDGPQTYAWWRAGVDAARSVAVVRQRLGKRMGTGFLVRAADLGLLAAPQELLLLTNYHVVNPDPADRGLRPADAEVVFEAADPQQAYAVQELVWCSGVTGHDASLLRLAALPPGVGPLPVAMALPPVPPPEEKKRPRVYVIGHPGGRELAFSFQDNELLDHEGPPAGKPRNPAICRVHYRAPTEGGSSGSPVFEDRQWKVIALHHAGGKLGMARLNGAPGSYGANEGLALHTLAAAAAAALNKPAP
jgi:hypothetical protein